MKQTGVVSSSKQCTFTYTPPASVHAQQMSSTTPLCAACAEAEDAMMASLAADTGSSDAQDWERDPLLLRRMAAVREAERCTWQKTLN